MKYVFSHTLNWHIVRGHKKIMSPLQTVRFCQGIHNIVNNASVDPLNFLQAKNKGDSYYFFLCTLSQLAPSGETELSGNS